MQGEREDESYYLFSCNTEHNRLVSEALIKTEEYKQIMTEQVRKDPPATMGEAIKVINTEKMEIGEEFTFSYLL